MIALQPYPLYEPDVDLCGRLLSNAAPRQARHTLIVGINNLGNDRYFLFRPFPQRTFVMEIHYAQ